MDIRVIKKDLKKNIYIRLLQRESLINLSTYNCSFYKKQGQKVVHKNLSQDDQGGWNIFKNCANSP